MGTSFEPVFEQFIWSTFLPLGGGSLFVSKVQRFLSRLYGLPSAANDTSSS